MRSLDAEGLFKQGADLVAVDASSPIPLFRENSRTASAVAAEASILKSTTENFPCLSQVKARDFSFSFAKSCQLLLRVCSASRAQSMHLNRPPSRYGLTWTSLQQSKAYAVAAALLLLGCVESTSTASAKSLISTSAGRALLLRQFSGQGDGGQAKGGDVRFRANRRGPDVGFISLDPICYSCLLPSLPDPSGSPAAPVISSPPPSPEPSPVVSAPAPAPSPVPTPEAPAPLPQPMPTVVVTIPLLNPPPSQAVIKPAPQIQQTPIKTPPSTSLQPSSPIVLQTPGPLPILGVAASFAFSRKLKGRIRAAQDS